MNNFFWLFFIFSLFLFRLMRHITFFIYVVCTFRYIAAGTGMHWHASQSSHQKENLLFSDSLAKYFYTYLSIVVVTIFTLLCFLPSAFFFSLSTTIQWMNIRARTLVNWKSGEILQACDMWFSCTWNSPATLCLQYIYPRKNESYKNVNNSR